jgi:competence protein ComGC
MMMMMMIMKTIITIMMLLVCPHAHAHKKHNYTNEKKYIAHKRST